MEYIPRQTEIRYVDVENFLWLKATNNYKYLSVNNHNDASTAQPKGIKISSIHQATDPMLRLSKI